MGKDMKRAVIGMIAAILAVPALILFSVGFIASELFGNGEG